MRYADALELALRERVLDPIGHSELVANVPFHVRATVFQQLADRGLLCRLEGGFVHCHALRDFEKRILDFVKAYHECWPYRLGPGRDALQGELHFPPARLAQVVSDLIERKELASYGRLLALRGQRPTFVGEAAEAASSLEARMSGALLVDESELLRDLSPVARQVLDDWVESSQVLRIGSGILTTVGSLENLKNRLRVAFAGQPSMTASQLREILNTTRKFVIPLLEYLDHCGFTRRHGDLRTLG